MMENPDVFFVLENKSTTSETKTVRIDIPDFTKKIQDEANKMKPIDAPPFKIAGKKMAVSVQPYEARENSRGIGVYLVNLTEDEKLTATFTMIVCSRELTVGPCKSEIDPDTNMGYPCLLTHEVYKKWAKENGDILKLEVKLTLHFSDNQSSWAIKG